MKAKLFILGAMLLSATAFGQSKGKGKSQSQPVPPVKEVRSTHGTTVSDVAHSTHDGKTVSAVASSKNKGKHNGDNKIKQPKVKKDRKIKKNEPVQKRVRTNRPEVKRPDVSVRSPRNAGK